MRVLVTGHDGYIGTVLVPILQRAGHELAGLDSGLFADCFFGAPPRELPGGGGDVRDISVWDLEGFDAVVHLAAISNDPMGNLDPQCTYSINHLGTVHLARTAKQAGVERFIFASSCSLYGAGEAGAYLDESAPMNPLTPYGISKVRAEEGLTDLADDDFSPTCLRNATVYGMSPRLRADLVVNNLAGYAFTTGEVRLMSDGTAWRPLVHVEDLSKVFLEVLEAPRELVHDETFNVGRTENNYRIGEIAQTVNDLLPATKIRFADGAGPDRRSYRVDFSKLKAAFPALQMNWTLSEGIEQLIAAFESNGLTLEEFEGHRLVRLEHLKLLREQGRLDSMLRWATAQVSPIAAKQ